MATLGPFGPMGGMPRENYYALGNGSDPRLQQVLGSTAMGKATDQYGNPLGAGWNTPQPQPAQPGQIQQVNRPARATGWYQGNPLPEEQRLAVRRPPNTTVAAQPMPMPAPVSAPQPQPQPMAPHAFPLAAEQRQNSPRLQEIMGGKLGSAAGGLRQGPKITAMGKAIDQYGNPIARW